MAGHPLRPATRRRLGRPLPHQQADRPRAHPQPETLSTHHHAAASEHPVLAPISWSYPRARGRLPTCYSPVRHSSPPEDGSAFDLHVLSTPPAFVLSQDQTLRRCLTPGREPRPDRSRTINQRNPQPDRTQPTRPRGYYLALTFGTLLSSQGTDAHQLHPPGASSIAACPTVRPQRGPLLGPLRSPSRAVRRAERKLRGCRDRVKRGCW